MWTIASLISGGIGSSGGLSFGGAGCSRVLRAIMNNSSELNAAIRAAGDVDHDCWGYENSKGETGSDISDLDISDGSQSKGLQLFTISWSIHPCSTMMISQIFSSMLRSCNLPKRFLAVIHWVSASVSSLIAVLIQWSKCHQQLKRSWLLSIRLIMSMKTCCWSGSFSMLWSSYMLTGLVFRSQTFSHSLGFVVDVRYPWTGKSWSHLNSSSWCVRLMGDGIEGRLETRENFYVVEAGEEPWINEGSTKGGWDSPSEVVIGTGLETGVLMMMVWYSCWYEPLGIGWAICWDMSG